MMGYKMEDFETEEKEFNDYIRHLASSRVGSEIFEKLRREANRKKNLKIDKPIVIDSYEINLPEDSMNGKYVANFFDDNNKITITLIFRRTNSGLWRYVLEDYKIYKSNW